ncbi:TolC family protein [Ralstonia pseudosolanacearum]
MTDARTRLARIAGTLVAAVRHALPTLAATAALPALSRATISDWTAWLSGQTADLTLSDAVLLGLRDNRSIRSVCLERVAQKFDLRVAEEMHAHVEAGSQDFRLAETDQSLEREIDNAVRDLGARWRQYEIARRACDLSRRKLDIEREKLQAGRSSNFQVLSFEADLRNAENVRLNTSIAYLNAQNHLDWTMGTTLERWEIDLND